MKLKPMKKDIFINLPYKVVFPLVLLDLDRVRGIFSAVRHVDVSELPTRMLDIIEVEAFFI
jgi:hypothetical protein